MNAPKCCGRPMKDPCAFWVPMKMTSSSASSARWGDGHSIVFIQDIIVHPEYQRRGIGTKLMRAMLEKYAHVYQIELATDNTEKTVAFYKSMGFRPMHEVGCCGFIKLAP